jgi:hypothetical protein
MSQAHLDLSVSKNGVSLPLAFTASRLVCCGWVGRDRDALQAHIDELAHLGVPPPTRVPIFMNLSPYLLTTGSEVTVVSDRSSGEVEYVLLCRGEDIWVTVGSDQTDRDIETRSIPASKQMYAKCLARDCWRYEEVRDHWNALVLRCWVTKEGGRSLYQEATLQSILGPEELLGRLPGGVPEVGLVVFSGTIATRGGLVYGDAYDLELEDPVLERSIRMSYRVEVLPQLV